MIRFTVFKLFIVSSFQQTLFFTLVKRFQDVATYIMNAKSGHVFKLNWLMIDDVFSWRILRCIQPTNLYYKDCLLLLRLLDVGIGLFVGSENND